jgi:D-tyrosyl-tRNA(Tyr) deacylase
MRAVVQRVLAASVTIDGEVVGKIDRGLVAFVGAEHTDTDADMNWLVAKIVGLRVFQDETGRMAKALADIGGSLLFVTQFTLYGDVKKGNRPSFTRAMAPALAEPFLERAVALARASVPVETGRFGADMKVLVENDGPVTIVIDSKSP